MTPNLERILVTGGCGFVGINLVEHLLSTRPCRLTLLDDQSNAVPENLETAWRQAQQKQDGLAGVPKPEVVVGDICDRELCRRVVKDQDAVVHLAAWTRVVESLENPLPCFSVNIQGTVDLLEACRQHGVERFILASSNAAVGDHPHAISEDTAPRPLSPYGATKLAGEALCSAYYRSFGIRTVSLRFSNAYGPYCQRKSSVVAKFLRAMLQGEPLTIFGDGHQTRDFINARDLCRAIATCLESLAGGRRDGVAGEVFQVATGVETSVLELVDVLARTTSLRPELRFEPPRAGEIQRNRSDISKLRGRLGYVPQVGLEPGVAELYRWFRDLQGKGSALSSPDASSVLR